MRGVWDTGPGLRGARHGGARMLSVSVRHGGARMLSVGARCGLLRGASRLGNARRGLLCGASRLGNARCGLLGGGGRARTEHHGAGLLKGMGLASARRCRPGQEGGQRRHGRRRRRWCVLRQVGEGRQARDGGDLFRFRALLRAAVDADVPVEEAGHSG